MMEIAKIDQKTIRLYFQEGQVLTKDMQINESTGTVWAPSVWTIEEKGMALALEKPYVLMIQEGIFAHYWEKTAINSVHEVFDDSNFLDKADNAVIELDDRYAEFAGKFIDPGDFTF